MSLKIKDRPIRWVLWHPHQRLWNWTLVGILKKLLFFKPVSNAAISGLIGMDTFLLRMGMNMHSNNVNKRGYSPDKHINYFDIGTHKKANELNWIDSNVFSKLPNPRTVYAFEANPESYKIALENTSGIKDLKFFNVALVNEKPESGHVRLYTSGDGLGDSIYRSNESSYVDVPAKRLSEVITDENIDLANSINILRMNIEGCEYDVIKDLEEHDLLKYFDGFYGMWDDVSKIDYEKDKEFRKLLKNVDVDPFPFNGRDLNIKKRLKLVEKSLDRAIRGVE